MAIELNVDAYAPAEMAVRVQETGVRKANLDAWSTLALAVLAGAFIGLGAAFSTVSVTDTGLGYGPTRVLGGVTFCLGLILVIVGGAELFTGNVLVIMAWASGRVTTGRLLRNWALAYTGNFFGAAGTAALVWASGAWRLGAGAVGATAVKIAATKAALPFGEAFVLGVLCNALVCLAVWLCFSARHAVDKIFCILFPIAGFVALGFEHSVANMYFIPLGLMLKATGVTGGLSADSLVALDAGGVARNLLPVTLGNIVGGGLLVAIVYWFVYLRPRTPSS